MKLRFVKKRLVRFFCLNYMLSKVLFCIIFAKMKNIYRVVFIISNENCWNMGLYMLKYLTRSVSLPPYTSRPYYTAYVSQKALSDIYQSSIVYCKESCLQTYSRKAGVERFLVFGWKIHGNGPVIIYILSVSKGHEFLHGPYSWGK